MIRRLRIPATAAIMFFVALSSVALVPSTSVSRETLATLPIIATVNVNVTLPVDLSATPGSPEKTPVPSPQPTTTATITPGKKPTPVLPLSQAGNTDTIVLIGILIVAIIVAPIMLRRSEWRAN